MPLHYQALQNISFSVFGLMAMLYVISGSFSVVGLTARSNLPGKSQPLITSLAFMFLPEFKCL